MSKLFQMIRTALAIGPRNIARAMTYRMGIRSGLHPVVKVTGSPIADGPLFKAFAGTTTDIERRTWQTEGIAFGWFRFAIEDTPPNWFVDPISRQEFEHFGQPWHKIGDFAEDIDIKTIWEVSRFDWAIAFAQHACRGDSDAIYRLNRWLTDWIEKNPAFLGPNWKCGQEASIRVLHLAAAALVLGQIDTCPAPLIDLVELHLRRIAPTIGYALSQDNNHGTSEAAALFIGGTWLARHDRADAKQWAADGRKWLEDRAARLIGDQGSFSQYSVNYHRLLLDTLSFVEIWRRRMASPPFSPRFLKKASLATLWLQALVERKTGDAPNTGANDGAHIIQTTETPYRDYRISVQRAGAVFLDARMYETLPQAEIDLAWLGVTLPDKRHPPPQSFIADDNGFAILRSEDAMAMLRYPRFRFRPSQADALHLDLWVGGNNVLRDGGSYSYNGGVRWSSYFTGGESHNSIMFDDIEQMPRLSRFLFGDWLAIDRAGPLIAHEGAQSFAAEYTDRAGNHHRREITLAQGRLIALDRISGFKRKAVLRWRLEPGLWGVDGHSVIKGAYRMCIKSSMPVARFEIVEGFESRHYLQLASIPVLEVEFCDAGEILSELSWL